MGFAIIIVAILLVLMVGALVVAIEAMRRASRPRPALPSNCGDCRFLLPQAKVYKRETLEDADGIVHYLCQPRWIEVTLFAPLCKLEKSKTLLTTVPD